MSVFYHATPYPNTFEVLNPATRNVAIRNTEAGPAAHAVAYDEAGDPYVYASNNLQLAMTYALPKGVRIGNVTGPNAEILLLEKENVIGDPALQGGLFSFESDSFLQLHIDGEKTAQWVSPEAVNLLKADFKPVASINDIMKSGVQVLQVTDRPDYTSYQLYIDMCDAKDDAALVAVLQERVQSGALRWINQERELNPVDPFVKAGIDAGSIPAISPITLQKS